MAAPMREFFRTRFSKYLKPSTLIPVVFWTLVVVTSEEIDIINSILCKQCGHSISVGKDLTKVTSELALRQRNQTIFGYPEVFIQTFRNPNNHYFEVITTRSAKVTLVNQASSEHTWFPGFSWQIIICPGCGHHLGWLFRPLKSVYDASQIFYGLILDHVTHDLFADSLLVVPRAYRGV